MHTLWGIKTQQNTSAHNFSKCSPILIETGMQCLGQISHTVQL